MGREKGKGEGGAYRFDALARTPADVYAEDAVAAPFALARKTVDAYDVVERRFHRAALKMNPVDGSGTVDGRAYICIRCRRSRRCIRGRNAGCLGLASGRSRRRRRIEICVVLGDDEGADERDEFLVGDIRQRIVIDHSLAVGIICHAPSLSQVYQ